MATSTAKGFREDVHSNARNAREALTRLVRLADSPGVYGADCIMEGSRELAQQDYETAVRSLAHLADLLGLEG